MLNKCIVCKKEFEALRPTKRTCSDACRQRLARKGSTVTKIVPIVTDTVTKISTVTDRSGEKKLIFTKDMPMKERIEKYYAMYPDSDWVPNWVAHGHLSLEDAIHAVIKDVEGNKAVVTTGLQI